jgi:hypothetical protein
VKSANAQDWQEMQVRPTFRAHFSTLAECGSKFPFSYSRKCKQTEIEQKILSLAATFVATTNLSFRQAASPATHEFIVWLIQLGASLPRDALDTIVDGEPLIDQMAKGEVSETVRKHAEVTFQAAMHRLEDFRFVNLGVNAGMVHHMKTIPCLISNPYYPDPPVLLTLRENAHFSAEQYSELFTELFAIVDSAGLVLSLVIVYNLPTQSSGLDRTLFAAHSPVIHIHCFAHMANLILPRIVSIVNCARIMSTLSEIQGLLHRKEAHEAIGAKCPRFIRTRWFHMIDTLAFILECVDEIADYLHMVSETEQIACTLPT